MTEEEIRADERERVARTIEADPGSHWVPIMDYCIRFDDAEDWEQTGCGQDPCPGHPDGYTAIHGRDHYAQLARSLPAGRGQTAALTSTEEQ